MTRGTLPPHADSLTDPDAMRRLATGLRVLGDLLARP
jgi:hypothetical protein